LDITTGASGDLKQANSIARQYISKYGMGNFPGIYDPTGGSDNPFVGRSLGVSGGSMISDSLRSQIDNDVTGLVEYALTKAVELLMLNEGGFNRVRKVLYEKQTIDGDEVKELMAFSNKISALPHI
jgi:cell division protease FtsH